MIRAFVEGIPTGELARYFSVSQRTARRVVALYGGASCWVKRVCDAAAVRLAREGASLPQSARRFGVSERTVLDTMGAKRYYCCTL